MKTLFKINFLLICILLYFGCKKENNSNGFPPIITSVKDTVLLHNIDTILPPVNNIPEYVAPELFEPGYQKRIILTSATEVYVTFVSAVASWTNSLGYYTYPVADSPSIANKKILFPNMITVKQGGTLKTGDVVQVGSGTFPAGTVIGFYLVAQGWNENENKLVPGLYTHYTDSIFNIYPSNPTYDYHQQSVLFIEQATNQLVVAFDDELVPWDDYSNCIFTVMDSSNPSMNPTASFNIATIPVL